MTTPLSLRWPHARFICEVLGVKFYSNVEHDDGDVRKCEYRAVFQDGSEEEFHWTPYFLPKPADCDRWLRLGRPKRQGAGPLDARTLIEMEQRRAA